MKKLKLFLFLLLLLLATSISCCLDKSQTRVVEIKNYSYQPSIINVSAGTTVTWINEDPVVHTVTATDGDFNSGNLATGEEFNQTFSQPGTYQYQCLIHVSMVGEVVVTDQSENASASAANGDAPTLWLKMLAEGFVAPMEFVSAHDGTGRMFVVDQTGLIKIITSNGNQIEEPFLDIRDRMVAISPDYDERGLLGLAFHPDFAQNGRIFVFYSAPLRTGAPEGWSCTNRLSEFKVSNENQNKVNLSSERVLLEVDKPQMNHNGGTIAFGPDGYLYLPLGDGGGANDVGAGHAPDGNGQNTSTLLGKILRIDVDNGSTYGIPADNPFVGKASFRPEIWAFGFRNPWRISFDDEGRLFVSDAGQNLWEEVDIVNKGGNYGWNIREGTHCFDPNNPNESPASCTDKGRRGEPLIDPIIEYGHDGRTVVVGGYIYRGKAIPELDGSYVFADWSSSFARGDGTLLMASPSQSGLWKVKEIRVAGSPNGRANAYIRSLGQDDDGELYLLTSDNAGPTGEAGKVYKIIPYAG